MTDEKTQTENIQEDSEKIQPDTSATPVASEEPELDDEKVIELTDTNNYPNQRDLMNHIVALYNQLNPSHKKLVRLTIARASKEI